MSLLIICFLCYCFPSKGTSLVAQLVKNPPAVQKTWVRSLGWEDPLENEKATHFSILVWRIPWTIQSMGSQRVTWLSDFHFTSLPSKEQTSFNCMAAVTVCSDFGAQDIKLSLLLLFLLLFAMNWWDKNWWDAMILVFWILSFKPAFSLSSFTFIKRLFSSSSLSAIRVVSSEYLWLLIFLDSSLCFIQPSISHDVLCI